MIYCFLDAAHMQRAYASRSRSFKLNGTCTIDCVRCWCVILTRARASSPQTASSPYHQGHHTVIVSCRNHTHSQVYVDQPSVAQTVSILRGLRERYEVHHGVRISDSALVEAAVLSDRYLADRFLPDKVRRAGVGRGVKGWCEGGAVP